MTATGRRSSLWRDDSRRGRACPYTTIRHAIFRTAPKLNLLPLGEANRTKTRFAANTAGAPDVFPDVGPYSVAEFLPVPSGRPPPLGPSAFSALPLLHCSMRAPGLREHSSNATPAHPPAAEEPLAPRVAGAAGLAGHGRRGRPRAPAPSRRPCTRSRLLPKPSISQRHEFDRGLLQNEPPMEVRPVVAMPLP